MEFEVKHYPGDNHPARYSGESVYEVQAGGVLRIFDVKEKVIRTYAPGQWISVTETVPDVVPVVTSRNW